MPGFGFQRRERRYEDRDERRYEERDERRYERRRRRRGLNPLWLLFYLILLIVALGLIFGGYRKGTPIKEGGLGAPAAVSLGRAPAAMTAPAGGGALRFR